MESSRSSLAAGILTAALAVPIAVGLGARVAAAADLQACEVSFAVRELPLSHLVGGLQYTVGYDAQAILFVGRLKDVACRVLASDLGGGAVAGEFSDDDAGTLSSSFATPVGFPALSALAICKLHAVAQPLESDFSIAVQEVVDPSGMPIVPVPEVFVNDVTCSGPATTTTSSTTTTSTTSTTIGAPTCADPVAPYGVPSATDCLFILRTAVSAESCLPECVCAPSGSLPPKATDALICLKSATGQTVTLACPCS